MHRVSKEIKDAAIESLRHVLQREYVHIAIADIELSNSTQPDVIESTITRVVQNDRSLDFVRVFDIEYNVESNSFNLWYIDIDDSVIVRANKAYSVSNYSKYNKYNFLFELEFDTLSDYSESPLTFLFDSEVSTEDILGNLKEAK